MSAVIQLTQILAAVTAAFFAWRLWLLDRAGPERSKNRIILFAALILAALSGLGAAFSWIDAERTDQEGRLRFTRQLSRLDTLIGRTDRLTIASRVLSDSLRRSLIAIDSTLAQVRVHSGLQRQALVTLDSTAAVQVLQLAQQRLALAALDSTATVQNVQLAQQHSLLQSQQRLVLQGWRQSFPLDTPILAEVELEYPADEIGLSNFVDSVDVRARRLLVAHAGSLRHGRAFPEERIRWVSLPGAPTMRVDVHDDSLQLRDVVFFREAPSFAEWVNREVLGPALDPTVRLIIRNRRSGSPVELRLVVDADTFTGIFQLDRYLSPTSPYILSVDPKRRTIAVRIATTSADVQLRTAAISLLDLPCSTLSFELLNRRVSGVRFRSASLYFGMSEYQWQLHVPTERIAKGRDGAWVANIRASDLFQSAWDRSIGNPRVFGWVRHEGGLNVGDLSLDEC